MPANARKLEPDESHSPRRRVLLVALTPVPAGLAVHSWLSFADSYVAPPSTVLRYGLAAGAGAVAAIWLANNPLRMLTTTRFRQFAVLVIALRGVMILWRHRVSIVGMLTGWD